MDAVGDEAGHGHVVPTQLATGDVEPSVIDRYWTITAHDVRTSIQQVLSAARTVSAGSLNVAQQVSLLELEQAAQDVVTAVAGLEDLVDAAAGSLDPDAVPFSSSALLRDIVAIVRPFASARGFTVLSSFVGDSDELLVGDPTRLRDVVVRAVRHVTYVSSGQRIHIEASSKVTGSDARMLRFDIRDTTSDQGPDSPVSDELSAGSEMTLQGRIVKELVAAIGGEATLRSGPSGARASIAIQLPLDARPTNVTGVSPANRDGVRSVLVVSDSVDTRWHLMTVLSEADMAPVALPYPVARDKVERLLTGDEPPSAVVIDVSEDPFEACAALLDYTENRLPMTVVVSSGERGDAARCRSMGIAGYLTHPISGDEIAGAVQATTDPRSAPGLVTRHWLREGRRTLQILLADDSPVNARLVSHILESRGHAVTVVGDGEEAVKAVASKDFDVVLLDVLMPIMDGTAAARAIREAESGRRVPIVGMSAFSQQATREACLDAGMDDYMTKPWQPQDLVGVVEGLGIGAGVPSPQ